jgi:methylase of polypeptide subunit release factors
LHRSRAHLRPLHLIVDTNTHSSRRSRSFSTRTGDGERTAMRPFPPRPVFLLSIPRLLPRSRPLLPLLRLQHPLSPLYTCLPSTRLRPRRLESALHPSPRVRSTRPKRTRVGGSPSTRRRAAERALCFRASKGLFERKGRWPRFYRRITSLLDDLLVPPPSSDESSSSPAVAFEVGKGQARAVERLLTEKGFEAEVIEDHAGVERAVFGRRVG